MTVLLYGHPWKSDSSGATSSVRNTNFRTLSRNLALTHRPSLKGAQCMLTCRLLPRGGLNCGTISIPSVSKSIGYIGNTFGPRILKRLQHTRTQIEVFQIIVFPSSSTLPQEDQPRCVGHFSELR